MKIVVCVKQVIDVSFHFDIDLNTYNPLEEDVFYEVNPADKCASELALRVKEGWGGEVIFIACGPSRVRRVLYSCLALGGDRAIHILGPEKGDDSNATAHLLATGITALSPDLIFCGSQSVDERCAEIPSALAELLDLPQVTGVVAFELSHDGKKAIVQRKLERGRRQSLECPLPAVLAVEPDIVQLRYSSLPHLLEAYSASIDQIDDNGLRIKPQLEVKSPRRKLIRLSLPRPRPKKILTVDSSLSADERLESISSGGMQKRAGELWEGEPQELARRLAEVITARL